jgi:hypothetical protein
MNNRRLHTVLGFLVFSCLVVSVVGIHFDNPLVSATNLLTVTTVLPTPGARDIPLLPRFSELSRQNDDCVWPCWWGLFPGESAKSDVARRIREAHFEQTWREWQSTSDEDVTGYTLEFIFVAEDEDAIITFIFDEEEQLQQINISLSYPSRWPPSDLSAFTGPYALTALDTPPDVYIHNNLFFSRVFIALVYEDTGVMVEYELDLSEDLNYEDEWRPTLMCLGNIERYRSIEIWLQSPDSEEPITQHIPSLHEDIHENVEQLGYVPLGDLFDVDAEEFTQFFLDNPESCLEANLDYAASPMYLP